MLKKRDYTEARRRQARNKILPWEEAFPDQPNPMGQSKEMDKLIRKCRRVTKDKMGLPCDI